MATQYSLMTMLSIFADIFQHYEIGMRNYAQTEHASAQCVNNLALSVAEYFKRGSGDMRNLANFAAEAVEEAASVAEAEAAAASLAEADEAEEASSPAPAASVAEAEAAAYLAEADEAEEAVSPAPAASVAEAEAAAALAAAAIAEAPVAVAASLASEWPPRKRARRPRTSLRIQLHSLSLPGRKTPLNYPVLYS